MSRAAANCDTTDSRPSDPVDFQDLEEERLARAALSRLSEPGTHRLCTAVANLGGIEVRERLLVDACQRSCGAHLCGCDH